MIGPEMFQRIVERLEQIEKEEDVVVFLAVESGSRAWGFPSTDSDYDVRFLYVRRPEWYTSIDLEQRRDVIERPIDDELDLSGWDLRKALQLFVKSNPPLLEWLQCKIIYIEKTPLAQQMRDLMPQFHSPRSARHHYWNMARNNNREFLRGDTIWRKKYFYVLRPLLAIRWIERELGPVPIEFDVLVEKTLDDPPLTAAIDRLIADKKAGEEMGRGPAVPIISEFIAAEVARHEGSTKEIPRSHSDIETLNTFFRRAIEIAWT